MGFLGEIDYGECCDTGGLGLPYRSCHQRILWDYHRYDPALFRVQVSCSIPVNEAARINRRSTVQFVGITAFHTQIADPLIGGTYMTVSNE
jgi:hypothetical protein